VKESYIQDIT
jgi:hypothetical protein